MTTSPPVLCTVLPGAIVTGPAGVKEPAPAIWAAPAATSERSTVRPAGLVASTNSATEGAKVGVPAGVPTV